MGRLLDEFLTTMTRSRQQFEKEDVMETNMQLAGGHCLDPLMEVRCRGSGVGGRGSGVGFRGLGTA
jgi:hypothetical protein